MAEPVCKRLATMSRSAKESELLRNVEEKRKQRESLIPYVHEDCVSNILIRLPLDSLHRSMFVCKVWFNLVSSTRFVETHLHRSETVLIFTASNRFDGTLPHLTPSPLNLEKPDTLSVETKYMESESISLFHNLQPTPKQFIRFLEFKDGNSNVREYSLSCFGKIRGTCNGLILLDNRMKKGGLIVINPVTRKLTTIPPGTVYPPHNESYGFTFDDFSGKYKVVHLFRDTSMYVGCEIFVLGTTKWRAVDGPSFGLFGWLGHKTVAAIGALHWKPHLSHGDYIVSMDMEKEKFHTIPLPNIFGLHDGLVQIGSFLSFVTHHQQTHIDIWSLKGLYGEVWTKQHSINIGYKMNIAPLLSLRVGGELIFKSKEGYFYVYDFELRSITRVKERKRARWYTGSFFPHVNSMVSWDSS